MSDHPITHTPNKNTFSVRPARRADASAMPGLEQSAGELFRTLPDLAYIAEGANQDEGRYRDLVAGGWCWVAEDTEGKVCAFLAAEAADDELHIHEIGVALDRQRLGIGRALIQAAVAAAPRGGFRAITLTTFGDVAWNAPIYERMGFRRVTPPDRGARLDAILRREIEAGLPADRRCAMRLTFDQGKGGRSAAEDRDLLVSDAPSALDIGELDERLNQFNFERSGIHDARDLSVMLRTPDGELYAGLHGHTWGGSAEIKLLWVADGRRGEGLGSALLMAAEREAMKRGCHRLLLTTHSFQAPHFYERHGFERVAEIQGYPRGHSHITMVKKLQEEESKGGQDPRFLPGR